MKYLLIAVVLLCSSIAFANDTTLALKGLTLTKGQTVKVEVIGSDNVYISWFRASTDVSEADELEVVFEDMVPGEYKAFVTVNAHNVGRAKKGEFALGKVLSAQVIDLNVE